MSDDKPSRAEQHLINEARKHQARQPQPPGKVTIGRVGRFNGMAANVHWLAQAWSPDGKQLAYGGAHHDGHGRLHLWHGDSGHDESFTVRHLTHDLAGPVIRLDWAPDGKHLASVERAQASGQPVVRIRSQAEGVRQVQLPPGLPVQQAAWSPDGGTLAVSGPDCQGTVLIDAASGGQRRVLDHLSGPVAWQPGGQLIAGVFETSVLLCDPATGGMVGRLAGQEHHPAALAWDRHGKHLAVCDGERIIVWDAAAGTQRWRLPWVTAEADRGPDGTVTSIQWLDGGGYLMEFRRKVPGPITTSGAPPSRPSWSGTSRTARWSAPSSSSSTSKAASSRSPASACPRTAAWVAAALDLLPTGHVADPPATSRTSSPNDRPGPAAARVSAATPRGTAGGPWRPRRAARPAGRRREVRYASGAARTAHRPTGSAATAPGGGRGTGTPAPRAPSGSRRRSRRPAAR